MRSEGEEKRVPWWCAVCLGEQRCLGGRKKKASFGFHKNLETPKTAHATEGKSASSVIMASKTCGHTKPTAVRSQGMKPTKHPHPW